MLPTWSGEKPGRMNSRADLPSSRHRRKAPRFMALFIWRSTPNTP
ncbi:Uncharacterised protein [Mycobacteroides abscessus subsp. abscessus]|nr:Uncharacterised protein [Mycobacteroides abscessus subsp. abscessus]